MSFQDPVLRELAHANSKSLVFPSKDKFVKQASVAFKKWCKTHFVPLETLPSWAQFIQQQWDIHLRHLRHRPKFHEAHVLKMKDIICSDWVVHLADHESTHLMVFCPKFYFQSCHRAWSDEKVFKPMPMSIPAAKLFLCSHVPSDILRKYPRGFILDAKLPAGQIFLKRKKSLKSGRTIISYKNTALVPILRAAAICIDQMVNTVWPGSLSRSVPQIWSEIHALFAQCPAHLDLELLNDDLVGFFNSAPQVRILEAVDMLVRMYRTNHSDVQLSVCINEKSKHFRQIFDQYKVRSLTFAGTWIGKRLTLLISQRSFDRASIVDCLLHSTKPGSKLMERR